MHVATRVRIAFIAIKAAALGLVILCGAERIEAAGANAGIFAALPYARSVRGAVLVNNTLGSTIGGCSEHARRARAFGAIVDVAAQGIWSTRIGKAGINNRYSFSSCKKSGIKVETY